TFLKPLVGLLGTDQPFFAVQPAGVSGEGRLLYRIEDLARLHVEEFLSVSPEGPIDLIGHCGGARVAFEISRQLRERGCEIANFIVIDTHPPLARKNLKIKTRRQSQDRGRLRRYRPRHFARGVFRMARRNATLGWAYLTSNEELRRAVRVDMIERACIIADNAYRAEKYPSEIVVLHTQDSPLLSYDWDPIAQHVRHKTLAIGHYTMFFEPDVQTLCAEIERWCSVEDEDIRANS
ncbi:MAG: thioesterase domain-containing protein, partial [Boseongicola sp.]